MHHATFEFFTSERRLAEQPPETVKRAPDYFFLRGAAKRRCFRAAGPRDDQFAAHRDLRPIRGKRRVEATEEAGVTVAPLLELFPERVAEQERQLDRVSHLEESERLALGRGQAGIEDNLGLVAAVPQHSDRKRDDRDARSKRA